MHSLALLSGIWLIFTSISFNSHRKKSDFQLLLVDGVRVKCRVKFSLRVWSKWNENLSAKIDWNEESREGASITWNHNFWTSSSVIISHEKQKSVVNCLVSVVCVSLFLWSAPQRSLLMHLLLKKSRITTSLNLSGRDPPRAAPIFHFLVQRRSPLGVRARKSDSDQFIIRN